MTKIIKTAGLLYILAAINILMAGTGTDEKMLIKMLSEKKMTCDLYAEFYQRWQLEVFSDVNESEAIHMQRIQELLAKYNITLPDEKLNSVKGKYTDKDIQKLYDDYTVKGCISDLCALNTAALMEEEDLTMLRERIKNQSEEMIIKVFAQMEKATQNHLKVFVKILKQSGVEYKPQVLSETDYEAIINPGKINGTASNK